MITGVIKNIMIMTVVNVPYFSSFTYWQLWGGGANLIFAKGMEVTFIHVYVQERMQKQHA